MFEEQPAQPAKLPVVLTIAGFDPSSGAGVTADLQTFAAHGLFGTSAITALTVQSTMGVAAVHPVHPTILRHTLEHLAADLPPAGIKIGMLGNAQAVRVVVAFLDQLSDVGLRIPIVLDPVLRSSSDTKLLQPDGVECLVAELLPLVSFVTPNAKEARHLCHALAVIQGRPIDDLCRTIPNLNVVVTGGEDTEPIDNWTAPDGMRQEFRGTHVKTTSTHGTGCAFSSALLSRLVLGDPPAEAIAAAKRFVEGALRNAPAIGNGKGPMDLLWPMRSC